MKTRTSSQEDRKKENKLSSRPQHIFVYGTLMSGMSRALDEMFQPFAIEKIADGWIDGSLYKDRWADYPFCLIGTNQMLFGEVWKINQAYDGQIWAELDWIEGYSPSMKSNFELSKVTATANNGGQKFECGVYHRKKDTVPIRLVGNNWREYKEK